VRYEIRLGLFESLMLAWLGLAFFTGMYLLSQQGANSIQRQYDLIKREQQEAVRALQEQLHRNDLRAEVDGEMAK
jgi:hypothetical protein